MSWLKFDTSTPEKPEVLAITLELGYEDPDLTVGKLLKVWRWFDAHSLNGNAKSVTPALLDRIIGVTGLTQSIINVGWMSVLEGGGLAVSNFGNHNGATAKERALTAKRVASHRAAPKCNGSTVTPPLAREEKRREEKISNKENTALSRPSDVTEATWSDFGKQRKAHKAPLTETALTGIRGEVEKAGMTMEAALVMACNRGWRSFKASWLLEKPKQNSPPYGASRAEKREGWIAELTGQQGAVHGTNRANGSSVIDVEAAIVG